MTQNSKIDISGFYANTFQLASKTLNRIGWVEERNPTFSAICWVSLRSTQPTLLLN
ncbi:MULTISPECIES: hypothetical protein [unclassified Calothrix]|uniref:hypothetical protein n=1 Tax=unclassified Calothrix TaxID=2619626 RepID=UPI001689FF87|nr:hypothetical protein [Calothrix sp. FACHB-168]MBD2204367.1 hypothetical protein [Calothrix sp. FACHB-168]